MMLDVLELGGQKFQSRLLLGTARYPSPDILKNAIVAAKAEIVTVSLRREKSGEKFWDLIKALGVRVLPNTAGCKTVKEAVTTAQMAREIFETNWIKLEVIGDDYTLQPDTALTVEAAQILVKDGFEVFPYTTDDLVTGEKLLRAGCQVLMPWGSPIGSGRGLNNPYALKILRTRLPDVPLIVDAGIGTASDVVQAMEMGYDAILLNTAVAHAQDSVKMAEAFCEAVSAGRKAFLAGRMPMREMAVPSTPVLGTPFWHEN